MHVELGTASRPEVVAIVADVVRGRLPGWRPLLPVDGEDGEAAGGGTCGGSGLWNVLWSWGKPRLDYGALLAFQRVNHIPNSRQLTRKDLLARHLDRLLGPAASVMPRSFALPQDYSAFVACFASSSRHSRRSRGLEDPTAAAAHAHAHAKDVWIIKPVESSRGRGIRLVDDVAHVLYTEPSVVQRYVRDPLLLRGHKFDLRLYVLVTTFQPHLEAFIYTEGLARFCTRPFRLDRLADPLAHLTNSSVQSRALRGGGGGDGDGGGGGGLAEDHPLRTAPPAHVGGSKLRLSYLLELLREEHGVEPAVLWDRIKALVLASLVAVEGSIPACPRGFELFGFDVLLDTALRPWLLEVNASPSMARESPLDADVKEALITDTLRLVDPVPFDRRALHAVLTRKLGPSAAVGPAGPHRGQLPPRSSSHANAALGAEELHRIMGGRHRPRQPGEEVPPELMGRYERLCPGTNLYQQTLAYKRRGKQQQQQQHQQTGRKGKCA